MGLSVARIISKTKDMQLVAGVDLGDSLDEVIGKSDVVIEFSSPEASAQHAKSAAKNKKPLILGTTGLGPAHEAAVHEASMVIPIVYTPNMSIGVNVMWKLIETAAKSLSERYCVDVLETHHIMKTDKPSGTAKKMIELVLKSQEGVQDGSQGVTYYEEALAKRRDGDKSIRVCSIREDEVVGDHEIKFKGNNETLIIGHRAASRDVFARGAITAARWIVGKPAGLYDMGDVLGFNS